MSATQPVLLGHDGEVAVVTFASPPLNLFDRAMGEAFAEVLAQVERSRPRAVLVRAAGKVVSGGVDVQVFAETPDGAAGAELWTELVALTRRIERLACPTVFAAHALCLTWAFEFALACDLFLAAESARFGLVEKVVGLTPAMGGTQRLAARAGTARAAEFVMTGDLYDAATLERWNVINRVLPADGFDQAALDFTRGLAAGPTLAHDATKRIVRAFRDGGVEAADAEMPAIAGALFDSDDLKGAVRSFLADGPGRATFNGR